MWSGGRIPCQLGRLLDSVAAKFLDLSINDSDQLRINITLKFRFAAVDSSLRPSIPSRLHDILDGKISL